MRNFFQIAGNVDVAPLMLAIQRQPDLWNQDRFRTEYPYTPHKEVSDILIRFSDTRVCNTVPTVIGDGNCVWHPATSYLPQIKPLALDLMRRVDAYGLDRVIITRLPPGGHIAAHADDQGAYVHDPERMRAHVVLQGLPGSLYRTGDETVQMLTGTVWWFNALIEHEITNNSAADRVHMLVDMRVWP